MHCGKIRHLYGFCYFQYLERRKNRRELKDTAQAFEPGGAFSAPPILQKHKDESANIRYAEVFHSICINDVFAQICDWRIF